jgi:hypothetical protein
MANLKVRVVRRDRSAEVIWDWPPGIDEVYFTYAHGGFPPRPSSGNRVNGWTEKRNRNEKNHQLEISNLKSQQPLFVAIWPKGTSNEEGLFGTDCREIKLLKQGSSRPYLWFTWTAKTTAKTTKKLRRSMPTSMTSPMYSPYFGEEYCFWSCRMQVI